MVFKKWFNNRREKKEKLQRIKLLTEEENENLHTAEKKAYLKIAKRQVNYRGRINAYKDFPINEVDRLAIDNEDNDNEDDEELELDKQVNSEDKTYEDTETETF